MRLPIRARDSICPRRSLFCRTAKLTSQPGNSIAEGALWPINSRRSITSCN